MSRFSHFNVLFILPTFSSKNFVKVSMQVLKIVKRIAFEKQRFFFFYESINLNNHIGQLINDSSKSFKLGVRNHANNNCKVLFRSSSYLHIRH